jgi:hypothetical protein
MEAKDAMAAANSVREDVRIFSHNNGSMARPRRRQEFFEEVNHRHTENNSTEK